jgi:hypothetical protein
MKNNSLENVLEGVLFLHSETGTEGGYWAFQDSQYIQKDVPKGYCKKCGIYLKEQSGLIKIKSVTLLDKKTLCELENTGTIQDKQSCVNDEHEEDVGVSWSYEGLHILQNGDKLKIYSPKNNKEVWSGMINLKQYDLRTEHASGYWIHADQIGIERNIWAEYFFKEYPAKLILSRDDK